MVSAFAYLLSISTLFNIVASQGCDKITTRKEIHDMTSEEVKVFRDTIRLAINTKDPESADGSSIWEAAAAHHVKWQKEIHNSAAFYYWHRMFTYTVEKKLQKLNPNFYFPYWDSRAEYKNGQWQNSMAISMTDLSDTIIKNNRNLQPKDLVSSSQWSSILQKSINNQQGFLFWAPAPQAELLHAAVHVWVGGTNGVVGDMSMMTSPRDPIFYIHHSHVDYLWSMAQVEWSARGLPQVGGYLSSGRENATLDTPIPGFDNKFGDVLDSTKLCYHFAAKGEIVNPAPRSSSAVVTTKTLTTTTTSTTTTTTTEEAVPTTTTIEPVPSTTESTIDAQITTSTIDEVIETTTMEPENPQTQSTEEEAPAVTNDAEALPAFLGQIVSAFQVPTTTRSTTTLKPATASEIAVKASVVSKSSSTRRSVAAFISTTTSTILIFDQETSIALSPPAITTTIGRASSSIITTTSKVVTTLESSSLPSSSITTSTSVLKASQSVSSTTTLSTTTLSFAVTSVTSSTTFNVPALTTSTAKPSSAIAVTTTVSHSPVQTGSRSGSPQPPRAGGVPVIISNSNHINNNVDGAVSSVTTSSSTSNGKNSNNVVNVVNKLAMGSPPSRRIPQCEALPVEFAKMNNFSEEQIQKGLENCKEVKENISGGYVYPKIIHYNYKEVERAISKAIPDTYSVSKAKPLFQKLQSTLDELEKETENLIQGNVNMRSDNQTTNIESASIAKSISSLFFIVMIAFI